LSSDIQDPYNISLLVYNSYVKPVNVTYSTSIKYRGILLGAMRKIQADPSKDFTFTTEDNLDYGPFLVSVNGMAGNPDDHTYWEILAELEDGTIKRPDVGVGCYIPNPNDLVIFKFTTW
ncbi:transcobalamin like precursor, partial [Silurus meridionalis]